MTITVTAGPSCRAPSSSCPGSCWWCQPPEPGSLPRPSSGHNRPRRARGSAPEGRPSPERDSSASFPIHLLSVSPRRNMRNPAAAHPFLRTLSRELPRRKNDSKPAASLRVNRVSSVRKARSTSMSGQERLAEVPENLGRGYRLVNPVPPANLAPRPQPIEAKCLGTSTRGQVNDSGHPPALTLGRMSPSPGPVLSLLTRGS